MATKFATQIISMADAQALYHQKPDLEAEYQRQALSVASCFDNQPPDIHTPYWAYWFARHVVCDRWPAGEELIGADTRVQGWYQGYLDNLAALDILGATTREETDFQQDAQGRLVARRKPQKLPDPPRAAPSKATEPGVRPAPFWARPVAPPEVDAEAVSDRIAKQKAERQRQQILSEDVFDED